MNAVKQAVHVLRHRRQYPALAIIPVAAVAGGSLVRVWDWLAEPVTESRWLAAPWVVLTVAALILSVAIVDDVTIRRNP